MGMGQQQEQKTIIPPEPPKEIVELPKPNRRKKMQDLDLSELFEEKPEDFLKKIKQLPGQ